MTHARLGVMSVAPSDDLAPHRMIELSAGRPVVEVCVGSERTARAALAAGADRLEVCAELDVGGTTPTAGALRTVLEQAQVDVRVMIRPRGGDFAYTADELSVMTRDIERVRACANPNAVGLGVVTGALTPEGDLDLAAVRRLVGAAGDLPVLVHLAVDTAFAAVWAGHPTPSGASLPAPESLAAHLDLIDPVLQGLIAAGVHGILTRGGAASADEGSAVVAQLQQRYGDDLEIVLGGGVRPHNVAALAAATQVPAVHLRAAGPGDPADSFDPRILADVHTALGRPAGSASGTTISSTAPRSSR